MLEHFRYGGVFRAETYPAFKFHANACIPIA